MGIPRWSFAQRPFSGSSNCSARCHRGSVLDALEQLWKGVVLVAYSKSGRGLLSCLDQGKRACGTEF